MKNITRRITGLVMLAVFVLITAIALIPEKYEPSGKLGNDYEILQVEALDILQNGNNFPLEKIQEEEPELPVREERKINLTVIRTLTDKNGNVDEKTITAGELSPNLFSFITEKDKFVEMDGTVIGVSITTQIKPNHKFESAGKYKILIDGKTFLDSTFNNRGTSDESGNIEIYKITKKLDELLANQPNGIHEIVYEVSQFYVIEKHDVGDGEDERFYLEHPIPVYTNQFELDERKTIIKTESGELVKIYNIDINFIFKHSDTSAPSIAECSYRTKAGCHSYYYTSQVVKGTTAPYSKLVEKSTNRIVGEGNAFNINIQRSTEYLFYYGSDPAVEFKTSDHLRQYVFTCTPHIITEHVIHRITSWITAYTDGTLNCNFKDNGEKIYGIEKNCAAGSSCPERIDRKRFNDLVYN